MRPIATLVAACLLVACSAPVAPPPSSVPLPAGTPVVGINYRATTMCLLPIPIGGMYWVFDGTWDEVPPPLPADRNSTPYVIPGVIRLTSPTTAIFRADTNGQEIPMSRAGTENPLDAACL